MPSAEELSKLYSKEDHITAFLDATVKEVEMCARNGSKSAVVDVPAGLKRADVDTKLKEAFPGCKVAWEWFIQSYRISWP